MHTDDERQCVGSMHDIHRSAHVYAHVHAYAYAHVHVHVHAYTYACTIYIAPHTHTQTHNVRLLSEDLDPQVERITFVSEVELRPIFLVQIHFSGIKVYTQTHLGRLLVSKEAYTSIKSVLKRPTPVLKEADTSVIKVCK